MAHETTFPSEATRPVFPLGWTVIAPVHHETVFPLGQVGLESSGPGGVPSYYTVSGAGSPDANGQYDLVAYDGYGNAQYRCVASGHYLTRNVLTDVWRISDPMDELYIVNAGSEVYPPTTGWSVQDGAAPVPTFVAGPSA